MHNSAHIMERSGVSSADSVGAICINNVRRCQFRVQLSSVHQLLYRPLNPVPGPQYGFRDYLFVCLFLIEMKLIKKT